MSTDERIKGFVLQEFRLHAADSAGHAARIVAAFSGGIGPAVPLLTSIDDPRDVATIRALHAAGQPGADPGQRAALDPLVASWQPLKPYEPRIVARSEQPPSYYRLAVTESGINNVESDPLGAPLVGAAENGALTRLGLLWTGLPLETHAGLVILLGSYGDGDTVRPDPRDWLPLSRALGVRIYESQ